MFQSENYMRNLVVMNRPDMTTRKFQIVIDNAKSYYSDKRRFENAIEEVIDNYEK